jgi:hypothetical protein
LCTSCNSAYPLVEKAKEFLISPTPTPTLQPTPTKTPTPTSTPEPQLMSITDVLTNCETLAASGNLVILEGKLYIPEYKIYGYEGWKGMRITNYLVGDRIYLTVLIKVGDGNNSMNPLPDFFSERDFLVRANDNREILNGHTVNLMGRVEYKKESENLKCALRVEDITSLMPEDVNTPIDVKIVDLLKEGQILNCSQLAYQKRLVRITGSLVNSKNEVICKMGFCTLLLDDKTGKIPLSIVNGKFPNSFNIADKNLGLKGWEVYTDNAEIADNENLSITGILYSDQLGCRLMVYKIY